MEELFDLLAVGTRHLSEPVQRGSRLIVPPDFARSLADGPDELDRRLEQVHVEPELIGVEVVERRDGLRRLVAVPADELADVGPVLLLDMGVVVLFIGPAPGEADLPVMAITVQIMVDELAAVVRWEGKKKSHNRITDPIE